MQPTFRHVPPRVAFFSMQTVWKTKDKFQKKKKIGENIFFNLLNT